MAKMAARRLAILLPVTLRNVSPSIQQQQQEPAGIAAASPAAGAAVGCLRGSLRRLRHSLGEAPDVFVFVGVDEDEAQRQIIQDIVGDCLRGLNHVVVVFPQRELDQRRRADSVDHAAASSRSKAPICYMWDVLAKAAVAKGCNLAVLLGTCSY